MRRYKPRKNAFYVYALFRPWDGSPCYIGKGRGDRLKAHAREGVNHYNPFLAAIFKKSLQLDCDIPIVKINENLSEEEAFEIEVILISVIGRKLFGGPLVNLTDGGEGSSGTTFSSEIIEKYKSAVTRTWTDPGIRARRIEGLRRGWADPEIKARRVEALQKAHQRLEVKEKHRKAALGKLHSETAKRKMSAASLERWTDPVYKENQRIKHKGQVPSFEARRKMSAARKGKKLSPEVCANMSAAQKNKKYSEKGLANLRAGLRSPEHRAAQSKRSKESWAKRKAGEKNG